MAAAGRAEITFAHVCRSHMSRAACGYDNFASVLPHLHGNIFMDDKGAALLSGLQHRVTGAMPGGGIWDARTIRRKLYRCTINLMPVAVCEMTPVLLS